jgi:ornithine carbamoyltransferase
VAFEVAVMQLGGLVTYLGDDIKLGAREPVKDVARVLSRYVDGVVLRTFGHDIVEEFAAYSGVPVINGLSDSAHPCQALADVLTIRDCFGKLAGVRVAYVGDGNNVLHSLSQACALTGVHLSVATPDRYRPDAKLWAEALKLARISGSRLRWLPKPQEAVRDAQLIYTDVWVSMGQEHSRAERLGEFRGYQVNEELLALAARGCKVMHCLPAHRGEEITDSVMEGKRSIVFDQAENRLHVQKALLAFLMKRSKR